MISLAGRLRHTEPPALGLPPDQRLLDQLDGLVAGAEQGDVTGVAVITVGRDAAGSWFHLADPAQLDAAIAQVAVLQQRLVLARLERMRPAG